MRFTNCHAFLICSHHHLRINHASQGNGHYFPLKNHSSESHNPLLANEDMWEESDEGSDEESLGESVVSYRTSINDFFLIIRKV